MLVRGSGRVRRVVNLIGAVVVSALLLGVLGFGYGAIPALGPALDPGRGAWTSAAGGQPVRSERLQLPGLAGTATVSFNAQGLASVIGGQHARHVPRARVRARRSSGCRRWTPSDASAKGGSPSWRARATWRATSSSCALACCAPRRTSGRTPRGHPHRAARLRAGRERRHRPGPRLRRLARALLAHRPVPAPVDPGGQPGHPGRAHPGARLHHRAP